MTDNQDDEIKEDQEEMKIKEREEEDDQEEKTTNNKYIFSIRDANFLFTLIRSTSS